MNLKSTVLMTKVRAGKFTNPDSYYYVSVKEGEIIL
jgi:hypothetical protein